MKRVGLYEPSGTAAAIALLLAVLLAGSVSAAPARLQSLTDLPGDPVLDDGLVVVNDGGPNPLEITVSVQGTTPLTHLQVQFEGRKGGVRFHYQICDFVTDANGDGASSTTSTEEQRRSSETRSHSAPAALSLRVSTRLSSSSFARSPCLQQTPGTCS